MYDGTCTYILDKQITEVLKCGSLGSRSDVFEINWRRNRGGRGGGD